MHQGRGSEPEDPPGPDYASPGQALPRRIEIISDPLAPRPQPPEAYDPAPSPERLAEAEPAWQVGEPVAAAAPGPPPQASYPPSAMQPSYPPPVQASPVVSPLPAGALLLDGRVYAPAGFMLRLRGFLLDFVLLAILGAILLALVDLPQPDPVRQLELSMRVLQDTGAGRLPTGKVLDELAEMKRPLLFSGWLNVLLCAAYFILFQGLAGATPGKALCGLRVLRRDGRLPGLGYAALRYLIYFLTAKLAYGVFTMPFDRERRALHDMLAGTNVYRELRWR